MTSVIDRWRAWRGARRVARWGRRGWFDWYGSRVYAPIGAHLMREVAVHGDFEHSTIQALQCFSRGGGTAIDVGANLGLISLAVLAATRDLVVHAYEPSPNTLGFLQRTRAESSYYERWCIHGVGCSDQVGQAEFCLAAPAEGAFDGLRATGRVAIVNRVLVPIVRLDDEWRTWGSPEIDWIKIDVEGGESSVLRGARQIIQNSRPAIVTEWNLRNLEAYQTDPRWLFQFARELGYVVFDPDSLVAVAGIEFVRILLLRGRDTLILVPQERLEGGAR